MKHYEDILQPLPSLDLEKIINVAKELLPEKNRQRPWELTKHGTNVIDTNECLCAYLVAYGEMHSIKCRAACQNFPFTELYNSYEIVDWGCGQGIASMSIIEILQDREKLRLLKKITLIEPSTKALQRAALHLRKIISDIEIEPINLYMPGSKSENVIEYIDFNQPITIHLFSNILDIVEIDLRDLAKLISSSGRKHFILCIGPLNTNAKRIDEFCEYFSPTNYFSNICNVSYAFTSDTKYQFSCKTKCFEFSTTNFILNGDVIKAIPDICNEDDYDFPFPLSNLPEGSEKLYQKLRSQLNEKDHLIIKPFINGDSPDFLVIRPHKGVLLINVHEKKGFDVDAIDKIKTYQENIIKEHIDILLNKSLENKNYWKIIKTMLYFPHCDQKSLNDEKSKIEEKKTIYTELIGYDTIEDQNINLFKLIKLHFDNLDFDDELYSCFCSVVYPKIHKFEDGLALNLTKEQEKLSKSVEGARQKILGVAGSGKTQVLVNRAINAHLRTGTSVLILTFNITLVNYLKYKIGKVQADFVLDKIQIFNYNHFFKTQAKIHNKKNFKESSDEVNFFADVIKNTHRYRSIFIDEIQDFKTEWIEIITKYFLTTNGEFVVFGDTKQNVYQRPLDYEKNIIVKGIPGKWNNSLNHSFRFSTGKLTDLAMAFQHHFFPAYHQEVILHDPTLSLEEKTYYEYAMCEEKKHSDYARWISSVIDKYKIDKSKLAILSRSINFLREVEYHYRNNFSHETNMINFETQEEKENNHTLTINDIRRNRKIHFTMNTSLLKFSTIHSFKGWEAHSIILFIEDNENNENDEDDGRNENIDELIYTAITRSKLNLYIINIGNNKYNDFFKKFNDSQL